MCCAPAKLWWGFRGAAEIQSEAPGASAAREERVPGPASLGAPSPGAGQAGGDSRDPGLAGSEQCSAARSRLFPQPLQYVVTVYVKITDLSKYLLLDHVLRSGCRALRNGKPPPSSCQSGLRLGLGCG